MTRKQLDARRERNRELAIADRAHRCAVCLRALPATGAKTLFGDDRKFCSDDCLDSAEHAAHHRLVP